MHRRVALMLFGLLALALAPARAGAAEVVAIVNGEPLLRSEFGQALLGTLGPSAMETLVDWTLVAQQARRRGITASDDELAARRRLEVDLRLRAVMARARLGPGEFRATLEAGGWSLEDLRQELDATISANALRVRLLAEKLLEPTMDLSEGALRAHYERTRGERRLAAHIVVRTRAEADRLLDRLRRSPDGWADAVLRTSLDRASVPYNGRLQPVPVASALGRALADVPEGGMTLFEGDGGAWHVVRALGSVPAAAEPFDEVADRLKAELRVLRADAPFQALLAELNARADVIVNLSSEPRRRRILGGDAAAFVNGEPLADAEVAEMLVEEYGRTMIGPYVERTLIFQEAARLGVTVSREECEERRALIAAQLLEEQAAERGMSPEGLRSLLAGSGFGPEQIKAELARRLVCPEDVRATLLAEKLVADGLEVTEADIRDAYRELHGPRIIVKELSTEDGAAADRMYRSLARGLSMDLVARTQTARLGRWLEGAPLVTVTPGHPLWRYAYDLKVGGTSGVFQQGGRYRIIKALQRSSPSDAPPLESVRDSLARDVRMRKLRARTGALLLKLRAESDVEILLPSRT